jgi:hypothetical protein
MMRNYTTSAALSLPSPWFYYISIDKGDICNIYGEGKIGVA